MIDGEEVDTGDTNVAGIGSDEDKALRKEVAMAEPAWEGCGIEAGIKIWRIEYFNVVPIDEVSYGKFHKGDSYIILHTDADLKHIIYFYLGTDTTQDEQGTAAYKTVELDDFFGGEPIQVRVVMGEEPEEFTSLFESMEFLDGGVDSGFKHVVPEGYDTKLFQVRKVHGKLTVLQVPLRKKMIDEFDCFVLDAPEKIYVYDGEKANPFERHKANLLAENIENARPGTAEVTRDIDDDFWALLED